MKRSNVILTWMLFVALALVMKMLLHDDVMHVYIVVWSSAVLRLVLRVAGASLHCIKIGSQSAELSCLLTRFAHCINILKVANMQRFSCVRLTQTQTNTPTSTQVSVFAYLNEYLTIQTG